MNFGKVLRIITMTFVFTASFVIPPGAQADFSATSAWAIGGTLGLAGATGLGYLIGSHNKGHDTVSPEKNQPSSLTLEDDTGVKLPPSGIFVKHSASPQTFRIHNTGTAPVIGISTSWKSSPVNYVSLAEGCPYSLAAGEYCTFTVTTASSAIGGNSGVADVTASNAEEVDVNVSVASVGLTILPVPVTDPTLTHLANKALVVTNQDLADSTIDSITVTIPTNYQDKIKYCSATDTTCNYPSTCNVGTKLASANSCYLRLQAKQTDTIGGTNNIPITVAINTTSANGKNGTSQSSFAIDYTNFLYAAGGTGETFDSTYNDFAVWNGKTWSTVWQSIDWISINHYVSMIKLFKDDLLIGGNFNAIGTAATQGITKWNGNSWLAMGNLLSYADSPYVLPYDIANVGNEIYVGGFIGSTNHGTTKVPLNGFAKWDEQQSAWQQIYSGSEGPGLSNSQNTPTVSAFAVVGNDFYFGGDFTTGFSGSVGLNNIAFWNSALSKWEPLAAGLNNSAGALVQKDGLLYVGGQFTEDSQKKITSNHIVKWDLSNKKWIAIAPGLDDAVNALAISGNDLYVGGEFSQTSDKSTALLKIAKYDTNSNSWSAIGGGLDNSDLSHPAAVRTIIVLGNNVYVGGTFDKSGGHTATKLSNNVAFWDGQAWHALGLGVDFTVLKLLVVPSLSINLASTNQK